ncbi:MAG: hypothetical protein KDD62_03730 [Bdellovibrionales bacterium]|nr:hypothetical protein [Bdellovibrionales bacterium]
MRYRKIISFCLFGDNLLYLQGALENIRLAKDLYPEWETVFYVSHTLDQSFLRKIASRSHEVNIIEDSFSSERERRICAMYWRLFALEKTDAAHLIFRDCDSRLSCRERAAVDEWLASGKDFHLMYDHPFHNVPIMGGMWGYQGTPLPGIRASIEQFLALRKPYLEYNDCCDQNFLQNYFEHQISNSAIYVAHGEPQVCQFQVAHGRCLQPFPPSSQEFMTWQSAPSFVGQSIQVPGGRPKENKI